MSMMVIVNTYMYMSMSEEDENMTRAEIDKLFSTDEEDRFIELVIPEKGEFPELNLIGKKRLELSLDEVVRLKQYATYLRKNKS